MMGFEQSPTVVQLSDGNAVLFVRAIAVSAETTQTGVPMTGVRRMIAASCPMITGDPLMVVR